MLQEKIEEAPIFTSKFFKKIEIWNYKKSLVGSDAIFDSKKFPWIRHFEEHAEEVKNELQQILKRKEELPLLQDVSPEQYYLSQDTKWKTYFLYGFGYKVKKHCKECPVTAKLLESVPQLETAFFSILEPGKHITPHRGPYNGILRFHLATIVPDQEKCAIIVDGNEYHWEEGKVVIFDDTYFHEAWNKSDETRVVLWIDFHRPLPFPFSLINNIILSLLKLSSFGKRGRKGLKKIDSK